jgi:preprotein translocase subunit SecG
MGSAFIPRERMTQEQSRVQEQIETAVDPTQVPNFPTTVPETETETGEEIPPMPSEQDNN